MEFKVEAVRIKEMIDELGRLSPRVLFKSWEMR